MFGSLWDLVMKKSPVTFLAICWVCGTLFFWWLTCKTKPQFLGAAVLAGLVSAMALARITILAELAARFEPRWFWLL
ncbi:MAG TPA: hypothetical protein VHH88_05570, partial [Verrucomicrobiae bacterium]|nr:hypothetical protein [Verrucomicrobiae bacterium]